MNIIFAVVTVISCLVFLFIINVSFTNAYERQNQTQLYQFHNETISLYKQTGMAVNFSRHNGFIILIDNIYLESQITRETSQTQAVEYIITISEKEKVIATVLSQEKEMLTFTRIDGIGFIFSEFLHPDNDGSIVTLISITNTRTYVSELASPIRESAILSFLSIFLIGNLVIWIFSKNIVRKLNKLNSSVETMISHDYNTPIEFNGEDEISRLAHSVEKLRSEISVNEVTKQEMMQNLGHDLKTPIAVIKSYAEAIIDGVSNPNEAEVIISQADALAKRVSQLLELTKAGYLEIKEEVKNIPLKKVILQVENDYKYAAANANIEFDISLDNSTYPITEGHLYTILSNLIDNALRYAKTKIKITLKNQIITVFNDGEKIPASMLPKIFKPYEKGDKGQFGLGMGIVKRTLSLFDLAIKVENVSGGVRFVITPI